jgi:uncharacterized membrane protein YccF (DUF307 family)
MPAQPAPTDQAQFPLYQQTTYPNGMPVQPYGTPSLAQPNVQQPQYAQHFAPTGQQPVMVNVNVNQQVNGFVQSAPIIIAPTASGPGFLVRALWFCFVGWWLGGLAIYAAYALAITVLGLPLAFLIFDKVPAILTLRGRTKTLAATTTNGITMLSFTNRPQLAFWQRALYFVFIGWWVSLLSVSLGYALCLTIIGLPLGLPLLNYTGEIMTMKRN